MNALEACRAALLPLGIPLAPSLMQGSGDRYITYNYSNDRGADFGDDAPSAVQADMQVHYVCPINENFTTTKNKIRTALFGNGFSFPSAYEVDAGTDKLRHVVFECEYIENI